LAAAVLVIVARLCEDLPNRGSRREPQTLTRRDPVRIVRVPLTLIAACLLVGLAAADTKIVEQHHADAFEVMGHSQPASDDEVTTWMSDQKMRTDRGDQSFIVRLDQKKLYIIAHGQNKVLEADLPITLESIAGKMAPMIEKQMAAMKMTATVTPTDERKTIGEWPVRKYTIDADSQMMNMDIEMWVTKDVPVDPQAVMDMQAVLSGLQPGMDELTEEMKKIEGYPVQQTITMEMMGAKQKRTQKVVSIEEMEAPAGTYDPPADYSVEPLTFQALQGMQ
jgi:hypothetical protein